MKVQHLKINKENVKKYAKKAFKITRNTLIGIVSFATVATTGYAGCVHISLNNITINKESVKEIVKSYGDEPITLIGFNDSQTMNLNFCFWEANAMEYVKNELVNQGATVNFVNTASLKYNKTNHIDKMLTNNLSIEEIKTLNLIGAKTYFTELSSQINFPIDLNFIGPLFADSVKDGDEAMHISTMIKHSSSPIIIYTSGANDLMRALNNNPMSIKKYDENGNINDSYLYSVYKSNQAFVLDNIMKQVEINSKNIYSVNPNSKIYALSLYVPSNITGEDMQPFIEIIDKYNQRLDELCKIYGIHYISTAELAPVYTEKNNFHISEKGHKTLANLLIQEIAYDCLDTQHYNHSQYSNNLNITNQGLNGFANELKDDMQKMSIENYEGLNSNYLNTVYEAIKSEIQSEVDVANKSKEYIKQKKN